MDDESLSPFAKRPIAASNEDTRRDVKPTKKHDKMSHSTGQIQRVLYAFCCIIIKCQLHTAEREPYDLP